MGGARCPRCSPRTCGRPHWEAQTVLPSVTLVSHASMLTGVTPARHAISWNDYKPERGIVKVPTVFCSPRQGLENGDVREQKKLMHLDIPGCSTGSSTLASPPKGPPLRSPSPFFRRASRTSASSTSQIPTAPDIRRGGGSPEQKQAFADSDQALKVILQAIRKAGIEKSSVVLITADHGGHGKRHGSDSPEDMIIPGSPGARASAAGTRSRGA